MHLPRSALAVALLCAAAAASATEPPPRVGNAAPPMLDAAAAKDAAAKDAAAKDAAAKDAAAKDAAAKGAAARAAQPPARPTKPPPRRRSVQMTVDGMPASAPPAVYAPTLTTRPSPIVTSPSVGLAPPAPVIMNSCDAGGCFGTDGKRYNGGVGATLIGPQGRLCSNNGITVQC